MRVLLVITGLGMGGAEHVVVNLADELVSCGHIVKIAYLTGPALVLPKSPDVEVVSIGMTGAKSFFTALLKLRKIVAAFRPDVVHSHMVHANILSRLVRLTVNIPKLISTAHSKNEGGKLRMLAYRMTDKLADISTNVSEEAVAEFVAQGAVKPGRMIAVPNGIDTNKFKFNVFARDSMRKKLGVNNKKILLAVGRLDPAKDYPNLLQAVFLLKEKRQDFKLFIVGDGALRADLIRRVKELELTEDVEFLGVRRDVAQLMSAADVFVLSSAWEGFGLVVAEAMACERPVVATDCGGVKEVVGGMGFTVPIGESDALANSISMVLGMNTTDRLLLGVNARRRIVQEYSLENSIKTYLDNYFK
ncbi:glycosyltransferase [Thiopseudomonas alkaliphila]|uniref:glycosyltransferase n=1 Tax=Thiopseudomonas alkaliphila TaxID=1697053 RepID=UPI0025770094|nr:glycosyltransferase [Thiopseudomonas alkaliphila]MDM1707279.1 glycosyltransferase [Thiopseudomonas alkaliphila]